MAGILDALGTAARGLQVVQRGLATTGHNIANAETPGYSRQRAVLRSTPPRIERSGAIGTGVEQQTVERIVDRFATMRLVSETSRLSQLESESSFYGEIEAIVNDQQAGGLSTDLSAFFDSLDGLARSDAPGQAIARADVIAKAETLVDAVDRWDAQLRGLQRDADRGLVAALPEINELVEQIARLNGEISEAEVLAPANDLRDQQEQLVLELAEKIGVTTQRTDDGQLSVRLAGGLPLVDGRIPSRLEAVVDPSNPNPLDPTFSQIFFSGAGSSFDVTAQLRGGEVGAFIDARENILAGTVAELDAFVFTLVEAFNGVHRAGVGLVDGASNDFFEDLSGQSTVDGAARNFRLSAAVDPSRGGTIDNIAAGTEPDPAGGPGAGARPGDVGHVQALKDLRNAQVTSYLAGDVPGVPTGRATRFVSTLSSLSGEVGQRARSTQRAAEQQAALLASVQDRRDAVSSVSIDEEVAQLVKLQANFQANARIVRTVGQLFQDLLDAF